MKANNLPFLKSNNHPMVHSRFTIIREIYIDRFDRKLQKKRKEREKKKSESFQFFQPIWTYFIENEQKRREMFTFGPNLKPGPTDPISSNCR